MHFSRTLFVLTFSILATVHCAKLVGIEDIAYSDSRSDSGRESEGDVESIVDATSQSDASSSVLDDAAAPRTDADGHLVVSVVAWPSRIAVGGAHGCAISKTGDEVHCFGQNDFGQLGNRQTQPAGVSTLLSTPVLEDAPVSPLFKGAVALAAGLRHTCALRAGQTYCWGASDAAQTGRQSSPLTAATRVATDAVGAVESIASGRSHVCARGEHGVACWGANERAQVSGRFQLTALGPVVLSELASIRTFALGGAFSLGLDDRGNVVCWGDTGVGQCGIFEGSPCLAGSPTGCVLAPIAIDIRRPVKQIAAGALHACAVTTDDKVFCWGSNGAGQLGADPNSCTTPKCPLGITEVAMPPGVDHLALGSSHSCALRQGQVWCWGQRDLLGRGPYASDAAAQPVPVITDALTPLSDVVDVATKESLTCALVATGKVYCWGPLPTGDNWVYASPLP